MKSSVYKSEQGRLVVEHAYQNHLKSALADGLVQKTVETAYGRTFILRKAPLRNHL